MMIMMRDRCKKASTKRFYKSPRKSRDSRSMDPLYDITYFETGKKKKCYSCPDLIFISDVDYLLHLEESHNGQRMHCCICSECGKTFGSASELQQHILSKCGTQARFTCEVCGRKLMSAGSLYTHMLLHGESNYTCNFCGKQFHNVHHLKAHERTHTKIPLYTCEICGKGFAHRQSIITHSSLHTGIKPYSCEHCGKGFSCISNLLKHRKTHASTCGTLPLTSHRIKNAETKMRIRMNTPATAKQKSYSQFKMNELDEKRIIHAVRLLNKKKEIFDYIKPNVEQNLEKTKIERKKTSISEKRIVKKKLTTKYKNKSDSRSIDIKSCFDLETTIKSKKEPIINGIYKQELNNNSEFDSDDSMPLSTFISSSKNELRKQISATHEDLFSKNAVNNIENSTTNNENIAYDIYASSFEYRQDYTIHKTNHSSDKLHTQYADGFEASGFNDDEVENHGFTNNEETLNLAMYRKVDILNLDEEKILIEEKIWKLPRAKIVSNKDFNKDNIDLRYNKHKCEDGYITKHRIKEYSKELILQQENNFPIQIKDEDVSDLENLIVYNEEDMNEQEATVHIDAVPELKQELKKRYQCTICGVFFKSHQWLQKHQSGKGFQYNGQECAGSRRTMRKKEIEVNFVIVPNEIIDEAAKDDSTSVANIPILSRINKKQLKAHPKFMCKICGTILKYQKSMLKHQMGKRFKNDVGEECAGPSFRKPQIGDINLDMKLNYRKYRDNVETRRENKKVQCDVCKKVFAGMYLLKKHQKNKFNKDHSGLDCATIGGQKVRKCEYCPLYLEKGTQMKEHKSTVHANILTCDICLKLFSKPDILDYHRKAKHKLVPREELSRRDYIYVCDKCGAQYKHKSSLREHERTGCGLGPLFQCDHCDARLHNIYTLKTHMAKHVQEKKHLCTFCGMKFMMKVQLKNHLYRHTGEKPFKCTICPKAFAHSTSLDTHMSTHTGIKRYICLACGKRFSCYGNLDKHKASKSCKEWYSLNGEKKKLRILDEKPIINPTCNI